MPALRQHPNGHATCGCDRHASNARRSCKHGQLVRYTYTCLDAMRNHMVADNAVVAGKVACAAALDTAQTTWRLQLRPVNLHGSGPSTWNTCPPHHVTHCGGLAVCRQDHQKSRRNNFRSIELRGGRGGGGEGGMVVTPDTPTLNPMGIDRQRAYPLSGRPFPAHRAEQCQSTAQPPACARRSAASRCRGPRELAEMGAPRELHFAAEIRRQMQ